MASFVSKLFNGTKEEPNVSSNAAQVGEVLEKEPIDYSDNAQVEALLKKIDDGYTPSFDEVEALSRVTSIKLNTLPDSIYLLTNIKDLDLSRTPIISIDAIAELSNLQTLNLGGTEITSIDALAELANLQYLDLHGSNITSIYALAKLFNLQSLDLGGTNITSIKALSGLTNLQSLSLRGTNIISIKALARLSNLQKLDLSITIIDASELEYLKDLTSLKQLYLQFLHLTSIPKCLVNLNLPFYVGYTIFYEKNGIFLYGTTLSDQDINLFSQSRELILAKYESVERGEDQLELNEAKVIFLGYGGVGKTHTIERIMADGKLLNSNAKLPITQGIKINEKEIEIKGQKCLIRFWDFGGQEQMHAMHKYFMTDRTVYVIMVDNRKPHPAHDAKYWINTVRTFAKDAPILLFENYWEDCNFDRLDTPRLNKKFGENFSTIRLSVKTAAKDEFKNCINRIYSEVKVLLEKGTLPEGWWNVHNEILEKSRKEQIISQKDYSEICDKYGIHGIHGISDEVIRKDLLKYFSDIGICFSYLGNDNSDHEIEDYMILQPEWLTNAIYMITNNGENYTNNGEISIDDITKEILTNTTLLNDPKKCFYRNADYNDRVNYVLNIMREFELSYKLPGPFGRSSNIEFIPALCSPMTPESLYDNPPEGYTHHTRTFSYDFLPDLVIHRFIVRYVTEHDSKLEHSQFWNKGMIITDDTYRCTIDAGEDDNCIHIDVYSENDDKARGELEEIVKLIREINTDLGLTKRGGVKELMLAKADEFEARISIDERANLSESELLNAIKQILLQTRDIYINCAIDHHDNIKNTAVSGNNPQIADNIYNGLSVDDVLKLLGNLQQNPKSITQEQYDAVIDLLSKQDGELKEIADKLNNDKKSPLLDKVVKLSTLLSNSVNIASKVVPLVIRLLFPNQP